MKIFAAAIMLAVLSPLYVWAQEKPASLMVIVNTLDPVSGRSETVRGVVVEVVSGSDTLRATTNYKGEYLFRQVAAGEVRVSFSHLSYNDEVRDQQMEPGKHYYMGVTLTDRSREIEQVTVKGDVAKVTVRGDTLIYNAAAVNTLEWDETIEILRQMPGVLVGEDGSVSVLGENIKRTYVNGRLIFGNDHREALRNLLAREVVNIKVYEEASVEDRKKGLRRTGSMDKVLDIRTRTPIISAVTGHALASAGRDNTANDEGKSQPRYGVGVTGNYYSEQFLLSTNTYLNNLNRSSNRLDEMHLAGTGQGGYSKTKHATVQAERYWGERWKQDGFEVSYGYSERYSRDNNINEYIYLPTESYTDRTRYDTSRSVNRSKNHMVAAGGSFHTRYTGEVSLRTNLNFTDNAADSYQRRIAVQDGVSVDDGRQSYRSRSDGYSYNQSLEIQPFARSEDSPLYLSLGGTLGISENDGQWSRSDTLADVSERYHLFALPTGRQKHVTGSIRLNRTFSLEKGIVAGVGYETRHERSRSRQYTLDTYDDRDTLSVNNSWDHTYNYTHHTARMFFIGRLSEKLRLNTDLAYTASRMNRDEDFPTRYEYGYTYHTLAPSASVMWSEGFYTPLWINYQGSPTLPSIEQLDNRVNDNDPYSLTAGNPALGRQYAHQLMLMFQTPPSNKGRSLQVMGNFVKTSSAITRRTYFFTEDTPLPDHQGYVAPANSYLSVWDNIDGPLDVRTSVSYETGVDKLSGRYLLSLQYNYNKRPGYSNEVRNTVYTSGYSLRSSLSGSWKRHLRFSLTGYAAYNQSWRNIGEDYKFMTLSASAEVNSNFAKRMFCNLRYTLNSHNTITSTGSDETVQVLNAVVGLNFYKNNAAVSISGYDLLNRSTSFSSRLTQDYISNSWRPSSGRYWTVNLSYRFNTLNAGKTARQWLNDGGW